MFNYRPHRSKKVWGQTWGEKLILLLATGFYIGYAPIVPGTFGTLIGIPLILILSKSPLWLSTGVLLLLIIVSCLIAERAEKILEMQDPNDIVIDEVVGFLVTVWAFPISWTVILAGFVLFRVLDILKPFPIRRIEVLVPGGMGVVLDDVLAGVYGCVILHVFFLYWH